MTCSHRCDDTAAHRANAIPDVSTCRLELDRDPLHGRFNDIEPEKENPDHPENQKEDDPIRRQFHDTLLMGRQYTGGMLPARLRPITYSSRRVPARFPAA